MSASEKSTSVRKSQRCSASSASNSRKSTKRSSRSNRHRSSSRSKRSSSRSRKRSFSKKAAKKAKKRKEEMEIIYRARTRQAGLHAVRAIVVTLQIVTTIVMFAAFVCSLFDTQSTAYFWFYVPSMLVEIYLAIIGLILVYLYKPFLRWLFWISYLVVLLADVVCIAWIVFDWNENGEHRSPKCEINPDDDDHNCSKITKLLLNFNIAALVCFLIMMHSLILILSMCWHECHDGSMDQLMENKHGQRMIRKLSSRNGSVRTQRSSKPRLIVKTRKAAKTPRSVRAGSSEGSNRSSKQDTKRKMANADAKDCSDKVMELSAELLMKESDSERQMSLRNEAVDFKGNEKLIVASNGLSKKQKEESQRDVESV